jgi:hypothetical protein
MDGASSAEEDNEGAREPIEDVADMGPAQPAAESGRPRRGAQQQHQRTAAFGAVAAGPSQGPQNWRTK